MKHIPPATMGKCRLILCKGQAVSGDAGGISLSRNVITLDPPEHLHEGGRVYLPFVEPSQLNKGGIKRLNGIMGDYRGIKKKSYNSYYFFKNLLCLYILLCLNILLSLIFSYSYFIKYVSQQWGMEMGKLP